MNKIRPIIIGLTGGIGSGKTTAAKHFETLGFPLYNSDIRAKEIQNTNPIIIQKIKNIFGDNAYNENGLNKIYIANKIFYDKDKLQQLNKIVHPAVFNDFEEWLNIQNKHFIIKEAAILIESGSYKNCDIIISVVADLNTKINRIIKRDNLTKDAILARMENQLKDEERIPYSDYIIDNSKDLEFLYKQVEEIANKIKNNTNFDKIN